MKSSQNNFENVKQVKKSKKVQAWINSCPTPTNDENQVFTQILRDVVFTISPPGLTFQKVALDALKAASVMYIDQYLEDKERRFDKIDPAVFENLTKENNSKFPQFLISANIKQIRISLPMKYA